MLLICRFGNRHQELWWSSNNSSLYGTSRDHKIKLKKGRNKHKGKEKETLMSFVMLNKSDFWQSSMS